MSFDWVVDHASFLIASMELGFRTVVVGLTGLLPALFEGGYLGIWIVAGLLLWETLRPWRPSQPRLREGVGLDVFYTLASFLFFHTLIGTPIFQTVELAFREALGTTFGVQLGPVVLLQGVPAWIQYLSIFLYVDLISYVGHVMLHRFTPLWTLHKVHHSAQQLDVLNALRQHWGERLYYDFLAYVPMALIGFEVNQTATAVFVSLFFCLATHSNIRLPLGPAKYVFNNPQLHLWHHAREIPHDRNVNYGSALSVWDYLFRTAYLPDDRNEIPLGFDGDETFPKTLVRQQIHPFDRLLPSPPRWGGKLSLAAGLSVTVAAGAVVGLGDAVPPRLLHLLHVGYREQATALLGAGEPARALAALDAGAIVDRSRLERLRRLQKRSGDAGFGAPAVKQLLQIAQGDADLRFEVGLALLGQPERLAASEIDDAVRNARLLVGIQPRRPRGYFLLGRLYRLRAMPGGTPEDLRRALAAFAKAAALDPDYPGVVEARAEAAERLREVTGEEGADLDSPRTSQRRVVPSRARMKPTAPS